MLEISPGPTARIRPSIRRALLSAALIGGLSCFEAPPQGTTGQPPSSPAPPPFSEFLATPGLPVEITIAEDDWRAMRVRRNLAQFREQQREFTIRLGPTRVLPASYRVRGATSLKRAFQIGQSYRLNFTVDLHQRLPFRPDLALRRFYLQNMIFDRDYYEMRFSYLLLAELGLFPAHNQLVALRINEQPLGLYLLIERPKDAILRTQTGVSSVYHRSYTEAGRRGDHRVIYQQSPEAGRARLERLLGVVAQAKGDDLVEALESLMNLDLYLRWLSFNSLVRNGDSYDEVYFYLVRSQEFPEGRFELMAWDYDDIMRPRPAHPRLALEDPLLFACEARLDRRIQLEPLLYQRFRRTLRDLLTNRLTPQRLRMALRETRAFRATQAGSDPGV